MEQSINYGEYKCDFSNVELSPGNPEMCFRNGKYKGIERWCEDCDNRRLCFSKPDTELFGLGSEQDDFLVQTEEFYSQMQFDLFILAYNETFPAIKTEDYPKVLTRFKELMKEEFGECLLLDIKWACDLIYRLRKSHNLDTDFSEEYPSYMQE